MKTIIAVLALATCCLCAEVPYSAGSKPQNGLLVLPLRQGPVNATNSSATPRTVTNDDKDGLDDINAKIMERLRQEQGSERGVYHVYLEDGRLQRVQYTTAPISTQQQLNNYNQQQQTPDILSPESAGRRGVYFVQVPQDRVQALQAKSQQNSQVSSSAQLNQEQANQVNVRYLPVQTSEAASQNQFPAPGFNAQQQQQQEGTSGYVANVQYSQVEPIQGPVYSYTPQAITRILRYAPVY